MRINKLNVRNYRTLEELNLEFCPHFNALCGRNDSGKTNVVRVIRSFMSEPEPFGFRRQADISIQDDFPKWKEVPPAHREIQITIEILVHRVRDAGLFQLIEKLLSLTSTDETITLRVRTVVSAEPQATLKEVSVGNAIYLGFEAQEIVTETNHQDTPTGARSIAWTA